MKPQASFFSFGVVVAAIVLLLLLGRSTFPVLWSSSSRLPTSLPSSLSVEHTPLMKRLLSHPSQAPIPPQLQQRIALWVREGARRLPFYKELTPMLRTHCARCHTEEALDFRRWQAASRLPKTIRPYTWGAVLHAQSTWLSGVWFLAALLWLFPVVSGRWKAVAVFAPLGWVGGIAWLAQQLSPYSVPRLLQISAGVLLVWAILIAMRLIAAVVWTPSNNAM